MTTGQSASPGLQAGGKRGSIHTAPQAPPYCGEDAPALGPELFTRSPSLRWHHAAFGLANLALFAPTVYLLLGLPLIMREHGWSATDIGLFQLAGLPALLKFLLAVPVQHHGGARGRFGGWTLWLGLGYLLSLLALATGQLSMPRPALFALVMAATLMGTWIDIPVNAAAFARMPRDERMRAGGIRSAALFAGGILGGGAMLLVQQRFGWAAPFLLMALLLALAIGALLALRSTTLPDCGTAAIPVAPQRLRDFFRSPGAWPWAWLLAAYFPLLAAAWVFVKPLLLDHGFDPGQVAWLVGIAGSTLGACASLCTARAVRAGRAAALLPRSALANVVVLGLLALAVWLQAGNAMLLALVLALAAAMGVSSSLVFGLMMDHARQHGQAVDYGIQSSLFALGRVALPPLAGALIDRLHYAGMLAGLTLGAAAVFLLARRPVRASASRLP